jgi:hypothetical protein
MTCHYKSAYLARVETWHVGILLVLLAVSKTTNWLDPLALLAGGLFMGINFLLLSVGVRWLLSPTVSQGRQRVGISLLVLKLLLFLGLLSVLFFRLKIDGISFVVGVSCLLVATVIASFSTKDSYPAT